MNSFLLPIRGVRVDGDKVIIMVKGGNEAARKLCGDLLEAKEKQQLEMIAGLVFDKVKITKDFPEDVATVRTHQIKGTA